MTRRGLTLVEILAAIALLSLIAAGTLPVLRDARRALEVPDAPPVEWLVEFADLAMADHSVFDADELYCGESVQLEWLDVEWPPERNTSPVRSAPGVQITCRCAADEEEDAGWLEFACDDHVVYRFVHQVQRLADEVAP